MKLFFGSIFWSLDELGEEPGAFFNSFILWIFQWGFIINIISSSTASDDSSVHCSCLVHFPPGFQNICAVVALLFRDNIFSRLIPIILNVGILKLLSWIKGNNDSPQIASTLELLFGYFILSLLFGLAALALTCIIYFKLGNDNRVAVTNYDINNNNHNNSVSAGSQVSRSNVRYVTTEMQDYENTNKSKSATIQS